jgi:N-acetylmuramoyl-L-alanine amidase
MTRQNGRDFFNALGDFSSKKLRDLRYRTGLANKSGAELFLSIHANSFPQTIYYGAQTFFNVKDPQSKKLAYAIQYYLVKDLGPNKRRPKTGNFLVLNDTRMPGVTIEIGFLSNPSEADLLNDPQYRERVAAAIYRGVIAYFCNQIPDFGDNSDKP